MATDICEAFTLRKTDEKRIIAFENKVPQKKIESTLDSLQNKRWYLHVQKAWLLIYARKQKLTYLGEIQRKIWTGEEC